MRKRAQEQLHVYRCITQTAFLTPKAKDFPIYNSLPKDGHVLEISSCFGTEIRSLISDGLLPQNITATDVTHGYWECGQEVFGDEPDGVSTIFADFACEENQIDERIPALYGKQDLVIASKWLP